MIYLGRVQDTRGSIEPHERIEDPVLLITGPIWD
jgi:hypothetical protein